MRRNFRIIALSFAAVMLLFVPTIIFIPRETYFKLIDAALVASSGGVSVSCLGSMIKTARSKHPISPGRALVIAIFLVAFSFFLIFGGLWWWRVVGKPEGLTESIFWGLNRWSGFWSMMLLLMINLGRDGAVEIASVRKASILVVIGVAFCLFLISLGVG